MFLIASFRLSEAYSVIALIFYFQRPIRTWFFGQESELVTIEVSETLKISCDMLPLNIDVTALSAEVQSSFTFDTATVQTRQHGKELRALKMFKQGDRHCISYRSYYCCVAICKQ